MLTEEQKSEIVRLRTEGKTQREISKITGVSEVTIRYWTNPVSHENISKGRKKWQNEHREHYRKCQRDNHRQRYNSDPEFRKRMDESHRRYMEKRKV